MNARSADMYGDNMKPTVISLFAGCGGSSLGYHLAGFRELLAIDFDNDAVESFKLNFDVPIWKRDIKEVTGKEIMEFCNIKSGELDILDGSPPCQGFSISNKNRNVNDCKNDLFMEYSRILNDLQPKVFVMENVTGIIKGEMKGRFLEILKELKSLNYNVKCKRMNAKYYEVPQSRQRLIFIGVRKDLNQEPSYPKHYNKSIPIKDIIPKIQYYHDGQFNKRLKNNRNICCTIIKTPLMRFIENGIERKPTISELKKLSSFPESFKLSGSFIQQWARIGNCVPPNFMKHIALHIKDNILNKIHISEIGFKPEENDGIKSK